MAKKKSKLLVCQCFSWPATSHLKDFLQSFKTVMDFLWFRPIVKQKLAKQSVRFFGSGGEEEGENSPYVWKHRSWTPSGPLPKNAIIDQSYILPDRDNWAVKRQVLAILGHFDLRFGKNRPILYQIDVNITYGNIFREKITHMYILNAWDKIEWILGQKMPYIWPN